jgi:hypothetical protein
VFCCARFDSVYEDSKGDFVAQRPDRCHDEAFDTVNVGKEEEVQSERTSSCFCQHDDDLRGSIRQTCQISIKTRPSPHRLEGENQSPLNNRQSHNGQHNVSSIIPQTEAVKLVTYTNSWPKIAYYGYKWRSCGSLSRNSIIHSRERRCNTYQKHCFFMQIHNRRIPTSLNRVFFDTYVRFLL